jgi:hypothetical protein
MKIDIEDIKFWMDAIRNSDDRDRMLDSFWGGQLFSKRWLVEHLEKISRIQNASIVIHGGWNGVLANMLFNSDVGVKRITSVDIDPKCEQVAYTINKRYEIDGKFKAVTCDMAEYEYEFIPDIIINTSCEHITQQTYDKWLENIPNTPTIILQSNNYNKLEEHINCVSSIDEFKRKSKLHDVTGLEYKPPNVEYTRFMLVGRP